MLPACLGAERAHGRPLQHSTLDCTPQAPLQLAGPPVPGASRSEQANDGSLPRCGTDKSPQRLWWDPGGWMTGPSFVLPRAWLWPGHFASQMSH